MRLVRIGVAGVSVKVGDFAGNSDRLCAVIDEARSREVDLLVTPELAISGYSLEDRVWWRDMARRSWCALERIAEHCFGISVFLGLPVLSGSLMYNAAALVHDGRVAGLVLKRFLPTYSIFYEGRNWTAWHEGATTINGVPAGDVVFRLPFGVVSAEICEDMWAAQSPSRRRVLAGAEVICNLSASPFLPGKNETRRRLVLNAASSLACAYAYANLLGCDSSRLIFDGGGFVATPEGIVAEGPTLSKSYWTLTAGVVDLDDTSRVRAENSTWRQGAPRAGAAPDAATVSLVAPDDASPAERFRRDNRRAGSHAPGLLEEYATGMPSSFYMPEAVPPRDGAAACLDELFDALVLGLRDYFEKVGVFDRFLVALSGGRDSALCLMIAVHAAKALREGRDPVDCADRVWCAYLPHEKYSSDATREAARTLAEELGVTFKVASIGDEAGIALQKAAELMGGEDRVSDIARQNLQARVRAGMMLNWANSARALLLVTSNLSESAVGYTTTGGDNQGGFSPIANVPKTLVARLVEHIAERDRLEGARQVLAVPPSAELAADQTDEEDLMPYPVLDDLLYLFARRRLSLPDCWRILVPRHPDRDPEQLRAWTARFGTLFAANQWKREQLPVALKVMDLDLDPKSGFRFPVTQSIRDELSELEQATL